MSIRILVIENPKGSRHPLKPCFSDPGDFLTRMEESGERGLECAFSWDPHVVLLGPDLPGIGGIEVCRLLKGDPRTRHIPIVFASDKAPEGEIIASLRAGADEFILLPCSPEQVLWRVRAVLQRFERRGEVPAETLRAGPLVLVVEDLACFLQGRLIALRKKEFELLAAFLRAPGKILARRQLLETVWGYDSAISPRVVDTHVARIKKRLGAKARRMLVSVRGMGYRFLPPRRPKAF